MLKLKGSESLTPIENFGEKPRSMTKGEKYLAMAEKGMQKRREIAELAK